MKGVRTCFTDAVLVEKNTAENTLLMMGNLGKSYWSH
jgi:hypothetical protein